VKNDVEKPSPEVNFRK